VEVKVSALDASTRTSFPLYSSTFCVQLGDVSLDLANLSITGKVGFQVLDCLLEDLIILVVDDVNDVKISGVDAMKMLSSLLGRLIVLVVYNVGDVEFSGVRDASAEVMFVFVDGSRFGKSAGIHELKLVRAKLDLTWAPI